MPAKPESPEDVFSPDRVAPFTESLPSPAQAQGWHKPVFIAFLVCFAAGWVILLLGITLPEEWRWPEGVFVVATLATTLVGLSRRLPIQNVAMVVIITSFIASTVEAVGLRTGIPFGPFTFTDKLGYKLFNTLPWLVPLVWLVVIINGRGVARLIMRPWRKTTYYGFWVIGLTCLLALVFDLGLEPFAAKFKHYWIWQTPARVLAWHTAPWVNFLGWFVTALAILGFTTPWLINKQPIKQPTDYHPLVLWLLLNFFFATGNATYHLWSAVALIVGANSVITLYAIRGARW